MKSPEGSEGDQRNLFNVKIFYPELRIKESTGNGPTRWNMNEIFRFMLKFIKYFVSSLC